MPAPPPATEHIRDLVWLTAALVEILGQSTPFLSKLRIMARAVRATTEWLTLRPKFSFCEIKLALVTHTLKTSKAASGDIMHSGGTCSVRPFGYRSLRVHF